MNLSPNFNYKSLIFYSKTPIELLCHKGDKVFCDEFNDSWLSQYISIWEVLLLMMTCCVSLRWAHDSLAWLEPLHVDAYQMKSDCTKRVWPCKTRLMTLMLLLSEMIYVTSKSTTVGNISLKISILIMHGDKN